MKKRLVCVFLIFVVLLGSFSFPVVSAAENILNNDPHSGAGMLQIQCSGTATWGVYSIGMNGLSRNTNYRVSYWIKGNPRVSAVTRIVTPSWNATITESRVTASVDWTLRSIEFNSGNNTQLTFAFMDNSTVAGTLYVDDYSIERTDGIASAAYIHDAGFENTLSESSYGSVLYLDNKVTLAKDGVEIKQLQAGNLQVSLNFQNRGGYFPTAFMVASLYLGDTCIRTSTCEVQEVEKNKTKTLSANIYVDASELENGARLQIMLWDSKENIAPLCTGKTMIDSSGIQHDLSFKEIIPETDVTYNRGVNLAGAEFGGSSLYNRESDFQYYAQKGFNILRVPIKWERMQPVLFGELDATEIRNLKNNADWAEKYGAQIIIDVHNYSAYNGEYIGLSDSVTIEAFNDLWRRLSDVFKEHDGVYGYDIMNEPSGRMSAVTWKQVSQSCVDAIRANGDEKLILIEGVSYSSAGGWTNNNQAARGPWIEDPLDNIMYSAHCYFDSNNSGTYTKTFAEEMGNNGKESVINRAVNRLTDFTNWCQKYNVRGHLGEFGIPGRDEDDDRWLEVLEAFLQKCDETGMDATYWAGGSYWGDYPLSCQPTNNYTVDAKQMQILLRHLPKT